MTVLINMISYLRGKIINKGKGYIIIRASDVGYKAFISPTFYADLNIGQEIEVYTHQHVREDSLDLYGFCGLEELEMFELLLSVSGIGPKSALGVLSIVDVDEIKDSISQGDLGLLIKVSGIGRKTAERVVLELRDKVNALNLVRGANKKAGLVSGDEIDALIALGYSVQQAREALCEVDPKIKDSGDRIREVLRKLGK